MFVHKFAIFAVLFGLGCGTIRIPNNVGQALTSSHPDQCSVWPSMVFISNADSLLPFLPDYHGVGVITGGTDILTTTRVVDETGSTYTVQTLRCDEDGERDFGPAHEAVAVAVDRIEGVARLRLTNGQRATGLTPAPALAREGDSAFMFGGQTVLSVGKVRGNDFATGYVDINGADAGSPVLNDAGQLIGLVTAAAVDPDRTRIATEPRFGFKNEVGWTQSKPEYAIIGYEFVPIRIALGALGT